MTLQQIQLPVSFVVFLVLFCDGIGLLRSVKANATTVLFSGKGPSMVLPLFLSSPNASRASANQLRHLQMSDSKTGRNARMRLYDDLVLNGYYTTRLWIGTPAQRFAVIVDTGSTVTYVPCLNCERCGRHQDLGFQPELSSTYQPVKCNIDCNCDDDKELCVYERQYAEMSTSSGILVEDFISFGNQSELSPQRAVFGCENLETGDLYNQHADGIMGLGRGDMSIVDQLVEKGAISDSFSLCYGGMDIGGGAMVLGGMTAPSDMVFTYSDPDRSPYYNIDLKEIHVAGKPLHLNPRVFDGKHGTVLDSGTTYAYLPETAFVAFKDAILKELHSLQQIRGPDPNYSDICFSGATSDLSKLSSVFPTVEIVFGNGQKLLLSPENYLFRHSKLHGAYCLGIFQNGKDPTTLLGGIIFRNTLVTYDRENSKIGFWKTNCSELWERIHTNGDPSPGYSSISGRNSSSEMPPTPAPRGEPHYIISDELQIGQVTFKMSLNIKYSDLKIGLTNLTKAFAQALGIEISQVRLLNLTSKGNDSFLAWALVPSGSSNYVSKRTALSIIAQVAEHRMQLPEKFGSYQLIQWTIEPPNRIWRQQPHKLVVLVLVIVTLILGLLASGIWFIWRRRQQTLNSYKPVNAPAPEQELQALYKT
ncbi:hypothetical protein K2173_002513 [Erythroxylum novogranatense]|uniref:Peptidase A1 domain-containing protein n=1 Tax=Erythroxylum novogranatense TaxID=1862640 RepID=A0AAV8TTB2_9ROSI|nr:hypothetical protein K2173_002513 [Erythroxylum novogranatense]